MQGARGKSTWEKRTGQEEVVTPIFNVIFITAEYFGWSFHRTCDIIIFLSISDVLQLNHILTSVRRKGGSPFYWSRTYFAPQSGWCASWLEKFPAFMQVLQYHQKRPKWYARWFFMAWSSQYRPFLWLFRSTSNRTSNKPFKWPKKFSGKYHWLNGFGQTSRGNKWTCPGRHSMALRTRGVDHGQGKSEKLA